MCIKVAVNNRKYRCSKMNLRAKELHVKVRNNIMPDTDRDTLLRRKKLVCLSDNQELTWVVFSSPSKWLGPFAPSLSDIGRYEAQNTATELITNNPFSPIYCITPFTPILNRWYPFLLHKKEVLKSLTTQPVAIKDPKCMCGWNQWHSQKGKLETQTQDWVNIIILKFTIM